MANPSVTPPPPSSSIEVDEAGDVVRIEIPIDVFRVMNPQQLAGIEQNTFISSAAAAQIRRIVSTPKP